MLEIREFDAARDQQAIRALFIQLQDFERGLDPRIPAGEQIADAYLELMFRRSREFGGSVLVGELDSEVVGFVSVWTRYRSSEPDDDPFAHGFVSDLVVLATRRRRGTGRALLRAAEALVREAGARTIRLFVKAANAGASSLYGAEGFEEEEISMKKELS